MALSCFILRVSISNLDHHTGLWHMTHMTYTCTSELRGVCSKESHSRLLFGTKWFPVSTLLFVCPVADRYKQAKFLSIAKHEDCLKL